jgi:hypothetical protein
LAYVQALRRRRRRNRRGGGGRGTKSVCVCEREFENEVDAARDLGEGGVLSTPNKD